MRTVRKFGLMVLLLAAAGPFGVGLRAADSTLGVTSEWAGLINFFVALRSPLKTLANQIDRDRLNVHLKGLEEKLDEIHAGKQEALAALQQTQLSRTKLRKALKGLEENIDPLLDDVKGLSAPFDPAMKEQAAQTADQLREVLAGRKSWKDELMMMMDANAPDADLKQKLPRVEESQQGLRTARKELRKLIQAFHGEE